MNNIMKIALIKNVKIPTRGSERSAGIDFFVPESFNKGKTKLVCAGESVLIPSGIRANVPKGFALIAFNKSGIAMKKSLYVGACVVDEDYQGEIHLHLTNVGTCLTNISPGEKLCQFILIPVNYVAVEVVSEKDLYNEVTERGTGGFGSTNKN